MITRELIWLIREQFELDWHGIHGAPHWARVRENGLRIAKMNGANTRIVELFAFLHDSRRMNDGYDPDHGMRAAEFAELLNGVAFEIENHELALLTTACRGHSDGLTEGDITVLTCWDADRLDLGRVGIKPHPSRLCTEAARDPAVLRWALHRSMWR